MSPALKPAPPFRRLAPIGLALLVLPLLLTAPLRPAAPQERLQRTAPSGPHPPMYRYFHPERTLDPTALIGTTLLAMAVLSGARRLLPRRVPLPLVRGTISGGIVLMGWEAVSALGMVNPVLLPPPTLVLTKLAVYWQLGWLQAHALATLWRLALSFLLAFASAVPLGILMGHLPRCAHFLEPVIHLLRVIPAPAWLPLSILWFGLGNASAIFITWMGIFFPILINTLAAVQRIEPAQVETVLTFGGSRWDVMWQVTLPSAAPEILTGTRIGLGIGWIVLLAAENAATLPQAGLGWLILIAQTWLDTPVMMAGLMTICAAAFLMDLGLRQVDKRFALWKY
ncbi:MAG: ABC transporter permease [Candidatus Rokubacteria bacterium]|nr:ABC transporter permease [Candidatus Rokubacteria bacterium]